MALPELTRKKVEKILDKYCKFKIPPQFVDKVRIGFKLRGNNVTLCEKRPAFRQPDTWVEIVVAQFRFDPKKKKWSLYCADRNSKWHFYDETKPTTNFEELLQEVENDPTGIFWG